MIALSVMAALIADEFGAAPQVQRESNRHFIVDMLYIASDPTEDAP